MSKCIYSILLILFIIISSCGTSAQNNVKNTSKVLIFFDDFTKDSIGGYPQHWKGNAKAAIVMNKANKGRWMKLYSQGTYLPLIETALPETYTVEFDYIYEINGSGNNSVELGFFNRQHQSPLDADFPDKGGIKIYLGDFLVSYLCYSNVAIEDKTAGENQNVTIEQHKVIKVRIDIGKELVKLHINDEVVLKIPRNKKQQNALNMFRFNLWGTAAEPLIGNFSINALKD